MTPSDSLTRCCVHLRARRVIRCVCIVPCASAPSRSWRASQKAFHRPSHHDLRPPSTHPATQLAARAPTAARRSAPRRAARPRGAAATGRKGARRTLRRGAAAAPRARASRAAGRRPGPPARRASCPRAATRRDARPRRRSASAGGAPAWERAQAAPARALAAPARAARMHKPMQASRHAATAQRSAWRSRGERGAMLMPQPRVRCGRHRTSMVYRTWAGLHIHARRLRVAHGGQDQLRIKVHRPLR